QALLVRLRRPARRWDRPERRHGAAGRAGRRLEAVPALDPPPAVLARALQDEGGDVPRLGGRQPPLARPTVPHSPRARRPGAGRRGARLVPAIISPRLKALPRWSFSALASLPALTRSTRSSR